MSNLLTDDMKQFLNDELDNTLSMIKTLALIPSPSGEEEEISSFVLNWLHGIGAKDAYIDDVLNVVLELGGEREGDSVVFMAHTDTVFPRETPLIWREDEDNMYCPAVGDDTTCLAIMLTVIKYIVTRGIKPKRKIIFVANSCEEGLGNLRGSREIIRRFGDELTAFYTFDGKYYSLASRCVGSHRYRIECATAGGHSYGAFGNPNAIVELCRLVGELNAVELPVKENTRTTYNVGLISGGTSVNTIAQHAEMLYEYRSNDRECLAYMKDYFDRTLAGASEWEGVSFKVTMVGDRPCDGDVDPDRLEEMVSRVVEICERNTGKPCARRSGSTDCNSASSAGIPAVCVGVYWGAGAHTREEWVEKASIPVGLKIASELILSYFD